MVTFNILKNRTKAFEVFIMFSAEEFYKNKQFYLQYLATNQYLQSQHNIQCIFLCKMKLPCLVIGSLFYSYINYGNSIFG